MTAPSPAARAGGEATRAADPLTIGADLPDLPGALCDGMYGELFFPEPGRKGNDAKKICRRCPVQVECLRYAIENPVDGIWGGTSALERRTIARRRAA